KKNKTLALRMNLPVLIKEIEFLGEALGKTEIFEGETLFLRGSKSPYISDEDFELIKYHFPKSAVITISNAGHWLHAENPKDFYKNVVNFL
ncbi:MAG: alpha/beta hydrolase, partial [Leeuwenhoekiella sp.]